MPLDYSGSKKAVARNIRAERRAGKAPKVAVAIAMSAKRRGKPKRKRRNADSHGY